MGNVKTGGEWTAKEAANHINVLELKAALLALKTLTSEKTNCHVKISLDNKTAVACINKLE